MVPLKGIEPPTLSLRMTCSTPELQRHTGKCGNLIIALLGLGQDC